jgi:aspartate racemase
MITPHIGIVGCSAEGAALCYRTICHEGAHVCGPRAHPEVSMHTHALAAYEHCLDAGDLQGVADLMLSSAIKLQAAGAGLLICPDNSIHQAMPLVLPHSPLPWLHIAEVVAEEAQHRGHKRLALTGTKWLVESDVYPEKLAQRGIGFERPSAPACDDIHRIIMTELVHGIFKADAVAAFQGVLTAMKQTGCDAVVLGCTEIPLLMNDSNSPLPTLDSTRLLARAALRWAAEPKPGPENAGF